MVDHNKLSYLNTWCTYHGGIQTDLEIPCRLNIGHRHDLVWLIDILLIKYKKILLSFVKLILKIFFK